MSENRHGLTLAADPPYQSGFGNEFSMEALPNVLPVGRNSPQKVARGLYAEQLSGTAFTAPRAHNRRSWLYRVRPAAVHRPFEPIENNRLVGDFSTVPKAPPDPLRWDPLPFGKEPVDLVDSLVTMAGNGYTIQCRAVRFIYMPQRSR